jgi:hypothetical protein
VDRVENTALKVPFELRTEVPEQSEGAADESTFQDDGPVHVSDDGS